MLIHKNPNNPNGGFSTKRNDGMILTLGTMKARQSYIMKRLYPLKLFNTAEQSKPATFIVRRPATQYTTFTFTA